MSDYDCRYKTARLPAIDAPRALQGLEAEAERDGADADGHWQDGAHGGGHQ